VHKSEVKVYLTKSHRGEAIAKKLKGNSMKTAFRLALLPLLLLTRMAPLVDAQDLAPAVTHNTWTSGAATPIPVSSSTAAVIANNIYVVGGNDAAGTTASGIVADVQIYNATTNAWSAGVPFPTGIEWPSSAVVKSVLYVFGGTTDGSTATNAVWAYSPKTKTWTGKAAMPTARWGSQAVVEKTTNIIYVIGGYGGNGDYVAAVESYNPTTNAWTQQAPLLLADDSPAAGLVGTTILVADGSQGGAEITGYAEGYDATTNAWTSLAVDPAARVESCSGAVGAKLYDAGGYLNNGGSAGSVNESFQLSKNKWATLAPMPQGTMFGSSAVYKGRLYCIGGWAAWLGTPINNVQIYQP
jgi:N-acetylneuraminic acid mutarotase